jgi:hypothetical protein
MFLGDIDPDSLVFDHFPILFLSFQKRGGSRGGKVDKFQLESFSPPSFPIHDEQQSVPSPSVHQLLPVVQSDQPPSEPVHQVPTTPPRVASEVLSDPPTTTRGVSNSPTFSSVWNIVSKIVENVAGPGGSEETAIVSGVGQVDKQCDDLSAANEIDDYWSHSHPFPVNEDQSPISNEPVEGLAVYVSSAAIEHENLDPSPPLLLLSEHKAKKHKPPPPTTVAETQASSSNNQGKTVLIIIFY